MTVRQLASGILSYVPGINNFLLRKTGGTESARYCYSVWLRHLKMAYKNGMEKHPQIIAELGPGDSLGMGLAALLSGAELYYAYDVVKYAQAEKNLQIFDELVDMYNNTEDIPAADEFPLLNPKIEDYKFPFDVLPKSHLNRTLAKKRLRRLRQSLLNINSKYSQIQYAVPGYESNHIEDKSIDMFVSHAVLEHVEDITSTYKMIFGYLKPGGIMSHQIDFKSHKSHSEWNGHWTYSNKTWALIKGNRPFLINREPHSTHIHLINSTGFNMLCDDQIKRNSTIDRKNINSHFKYLTDNDLKTSGVFIQAQKPITIHETVETKARQHMPSYTENVEIT
jgi:hypothetical protein